MKFKKRTVYAEIIIVTKRHIYVGKLPCYRMIDHGIKDITDANERQILIFF